MRTLGRVARWTWASLGATSLSFGAHMGHHLHVNAILTLAARHRHIAKDREGDRYCCTDGSRDLSGGGLHVSMKGQGVAARALMQHRQADRCCEPGRSGSCCCCCSHFGRTRGRGTYLVSSWRRSEEVIRWVIQYSSWALSGRLASRAAASYVPYRHRAPSFQRPPQQQQQPQHVACYHVLSSGCCVSVNAW